MSLGLVEDTPTVGENDMGPLPSGQAAERQMRRALALNSARARPRSSRA